MITIRFACGHLGTVEEKLDTAPRCQACGETRVASVQARAPRFTGACQGPYCETQAVEPVTVNLTNGRAAAVEGD